MQTFDFKSPIDLTSLVIEGERIYLKATEESYAPEIFKEFTSEITHYMFPKPAEKIEETLFFISESIKGMQAGGDLTLVIIKKENDEFLGCCGFHGRQNPQTPQLGIWIKKAAHGHKYGKEAIYTLASWAVRNIKFDYTIYPVDRANIASRKIPESLGGTIFNEKKLKTMNDTYLDEVDYKITYEVLKNKFTRRFEFIDEFSITIETNEQIRQLLSQNFSGEEFTKSRTYLKQLPQRRLLVWKDNALIGHMGIEYRVIGLSTGPANIFGVIDLCVSRDHQGQGVASEMLKQLEQLGKNHKVDFIILFAQDRRIYLRQGYYQPGNSLRWLKIHEHQSIGIGEEVLGELMIKALSSRLWPDGLVDLLGYQF